MASKQKAIDLMAKYSAHDALIKSKLIKRTEFEITIRALKALFSYVHGIRQAANITAPQLSQEAKDGLQYLQDINQLLQDIKAAKEQLDLDIETILATQYEDDSEEEL